MILDLDETAEANHTSILCEDHAPSCQQSVNRLATMEKYNLIPWSQEKLITMQFESLEQVVL